jgi:hypothetical protein
MAEDLIRYDILVQEALRGVVRKVLSEVVRTGLPGEHHFFISFFTKAPGVRMSQRLLEQYDKEMTIVLQNQYWDLKVTDTGFEVGLSFDGHPETLAIPFSAMKGFFDPSVQFGLQLNGESAAMEGSPEKPDAHPGDGDEPPSGPASPDAPGEKVISLDRFRKKP